MDEAIRRGVESDTPVLLSAKPDTWIDAVENMESFADESRAEPQDEVRQQAAAVNMELQQITAMPRVRQCYGWLKIEPASVLSLPRHLCAPMVQVDKTRRQFGVNSYDPPESDNQDYIAIVYEYIEPAPNRPEVVEQACKFFWQAGFSYQGTPLVRNWEDSVLLDLSDLACPNERHWSESIYRRWQVQCTLKP